MLHQTIALELIQARPALCSLLRRERMMLKASRVLAEELKRAHERTSRGWTEDQRREIAIEALLALLPPENGSGRPTPEEVLAFVRSRT